MTNYGKIDVMWYDGWWPYNAEGWQAEKLNEMVRSLQPGILVNGRCGLPGDFTTPEQHVATSREPWESCVTLNNNWGYHKGDHDWKTPKQVAEMLRTAAAGCGNILLNIGPRGDGSVPEESVRILDQVGEWLKTNREAIYETDRFEFYMMERGDARSDFSHSGYMTASGNAFYWHIRNWPGSTLYLGGVQSKVVGVCELATGVSHAFKQEGDRLIIEGFAENLDPTLPLVVKVETEGEPMLYNCGGSRIPNVDHCRYDPLPSEIQWS